MKTLKQLFNLNEDVFDTDIKYNDLPDPRIGEPFSIFGGGLVIKDIDYLNRTIVISNKPSETHSGGEPYKGIDVMSMAPFKKIYNEFGCKRVIIDIDKFPTRVNNIMRLKNNPIEFKANGLVLGFPQEGQCLIQSNKNVHISDLKIIADESKKWDNTLTIYGSDIVLDNCEFKFDGLYIDCENLVLNNSKIKIAGQNRCSIKFGPLGEGVRNTKKLAQCILDNQWDGVVYDFMNISCKILIVRARRPKRSQDLEIVLKKPGYSGSMIYNPAKGSNIIKCNNWEVYMTSIPEL